jgi:hypothetical protein
MRKSNYDKFPSTRTDGMAIVGWEKIVSTLNEQWADEPIWSIDLYTGTYEEDFLSAFAKTGRRIIDTRSLMRPEEEIRQFTERFITDDVLFGYMSNVKLEEYFDSSRVQEFKSSRIQEPCIIIGTGAAFVAEKYSPKGGAERGPQHERTDLRASDAEARTNGIADGTWRNWHR